MKNEEMIVKVNKIIQEYLGKDTLELSENTRLKDDLELDSLDVFEIVDKLEEQFDLDIEIDHGLETLGELYEFVAKKIEEQSE